MIKKILSVFAGFVMGVFLINATAFAHIPVTEEGSSIPYESKGAIEVHTSPHSLLKKAEKIATLGLLGRPKVRSIKGELNRLIAEKAKLYGPDAVINVVYSPASDDPRFVKAKEVYAKGEMIKYKRAYNY